MDKLSEKELRRAQFEQSFAAQKQGFQAARTGQYTQSTLEDKETEQTERVFYPNPNLGSVPDVKGQNDPRNFWRVNALLDNDFHNRYPNSAIVRIATIDRNGDVVHCTGMHLVVKDNSNCIDLILFDL